MAAIPAMLHPVTALKDGMSFSGPVHRNRAMRA
ncbi:hypothetical protein IL54_3329 [Sphingobium sp. ba1]|nr:hypothetical protein IL54_3329 [Sphingobium sp. ba1]